MNKEKFNEIFCSRKSDLALASFLPLFLICLLFTSKIEAQLVAFPGAEGYGRFTTGGRGGVVYEVTNLNDSGAGSLRDAIGKTGPRTIVFTVSGTIELKSDLKITKDSVTIAGQTAPGDGICLRDFDFYINANNVIVRFIRARLGDVTKTQSDACSGFAKKKNIIIDHCSFSWSVDETASFYDNQNFTLQWCIISESLYQSGHVKSAHGYGGIWGGQGATFHHNLLAHHSSRNPRFNGSRYSRLPDKEIVDYRNNVIYNWGSTNSAYGGEGGNQNMVNNYYKPGPATPTSSKSYRILDLTQVFYDITVRPDTVHAGKFYIDGNYVDGNSNATNDNWTYGVQNASAAQKEKSKVLVPFPFGTITTQSAQEAYESVLKYVGACFPTRDAVDTRVINEVTTGTATYGGVYGAGKGLIDSQDSVGGWPILNSFTVPVDSDHDGMPNDWEIANSLNPNDPNDRNGTNADGYTMLEIYLNSLVSKVIVTSVKDNTAILPADFILFQNYPNPFNPSTVISYQISSGMPIHVTLKVYDSLGRVVTTLVNEYQQLGIYHSTFNAQNLSLASGIYYVKLTAGDFNSVKKMLLLK